MLLSTAKAQQADSALDKIADLPGNLFNRLTGKEKNLDAALVRQTRKYLRRMERAENKLRRRLAHKDSAAARYLFSGVHEKYAALNGLLTDSAANSNGTANGNGAANSNGTAASTNGGVANGGSGRPAAINDGYMPYTDSLAGIMAFIKQHPADLQTPARQQQLAAAADELKQLDGHFEACSEITAFIRERKQQLAQALAGQLHIPGIQQYLQAYQQEAYYYSEQVRVLKEALNDPDKMEMLALKVLDKFPAWQDFMQKNSILARLSPCPRISGRRLRWQDCKHAVSCNRPSRHNYRRDRTPPTRCRKIWKTRRTNWDS